MKCSPSNEASVCGHLSRQGWQQSSDQRRAERTPRCTVQYLRRACRCSSIQCFICFTDCYRIWIRMFRLLQMRRPQHRVMLLLQSDDLVWASRLSLARRCSAIQGLALPTGLQRRVGFISHQLNKLSYWSSSKLHFLREAAILSHENSLIYELLQFVNFLLEMFGFIFSFDTDGMELYIPLRTLNVLNSSLWIASGPVV